MSTELWLLLAAIVLGLVHIGAQSFSFKAQVGNDYTLGPRDVPIAAEGVAGRSERALRNFGETFPLFAAAVLAAVATHRLGAWSTVGASLYVVGRCGYLPAYVAGVRRVRTVFWQISTIGIVLVLVQIAIG